MALSPADVVGARGGLLEHTVHGVGQRGGRRNVGCEQRRHRHRGSARWRRREHRRRNAVRFRQGRLPGRHVLQQVHARDLRARRQRPAQQHFASRLRLRWTDLLEPVRRVPELDGRPSPNRLRSGGLCQAVHPRLVSLRCVLQHDAARRRVRRSVGLYRRVLGPAQAVPAPSKGHGLRCHSHLRFALRADQRREALVRQRPHLPVACKRLAGAIMG